MNKQMPELINVTYVYPKVVVQWNDGTRTEVKCAEDDAYSKYHGLCAAVAKKYFGSNAAIKRQVKSAYDACTKEFTINIPANSIIRVGCEYKTRDGKMIPGGGYSGVVI